MSIERQDFASPSDLVGDALTIRLRVRPQFQIARTIVVALAILMVHVLVLAEGASEFLRHHPAVLEDPPALHGHGIEEMFILWRCGGDRDGHIAIAHHRSPVGLEGPPPRHSGIEGFVTQPAMALQAAAREIWRYQKSPQGSPRIPSGRAAIGTAYLRTRTCMSVDSHDLHSGENGWMLNQRGHVEWSRHVPDCNRPEGDCQI